MLIKCKTCTTEFIPPRKNILNCFKCILKKQPDGAAIKEESEREQYDDEESESEQNDEENEKYRTTTN